ncbi:B12-binding domain-containing radical SAM protein [Gemmatimonadota bacterium]
MNPLRILLIDVNLVSLDTAVDMLEYPLGLLYVASSLKRAFGDHIQVTIESYDAKQEAPDTIAQLLEEIQPDVLGLRSLTMGRGPLHEVAATARHDFGVPLVIAGGPHASDAPEEVLSDDAFDCAVIGEGEETAVDLIGCVLAGNPWDSIEGIAVRTPNGIQINPPRPPIEDLDTLPIPDHQLVDFLEINRGHVDFSFRQNIPHANLFSSRGCPFKCIYCHNLFGKRVRTHSPERLMEEIRQLYDSSGITTFQIIDDIFNIDRKRAMKFFDLAAGSGMDLVFSFPNGLRGDLIDAEMVDAMWDAGVRYIAFAVESGSPRIQKLIQKNLDLDRIRESIALSSRKGILSRGFFMIGFPTETEEEALMTVEFATSSDLVMAMFFTVVYFPGTPLFRLAQEMCRIDDFDLGLENDYVRLREGPYDFSTETLQAIKMKAVREFFFSTRRLELSFDIMPNFLDQRDMDASFIVNIISGKMKESDIEDPEYARRLHRYFLIVDRFSEKSGFYV